MAVASFDGSFSAKQDAVARLGNRAYEGAKQMTAEEWEHFQHSPFMEILNQTEEVARKLSERRDRKRQETDPSFLPQDSDMHAPKAHKYDKAIDYYKTLGTDEYATQEEVKQAYKQLSLIYHPDKTTRKSQAEKDESAQIFLELKAAYRTLADNPTRRQYDRDRDLRAAQKEVSGTENRDRPHFDGTEVRKKLEEDKLAAGDTVEVQVWCRLEKFAFGGHKSVRRTRQVRQGKAFSQQEQLYRIHVPKGSKEPLQVEFKKKGDQHVHKQADTLRFLVSSKPHESVQRDGQDLRVKNKVVLALDADSEYYVSAELPCFRGQHLVLWGRNPFFRNSGTGTGELVVNLRGAGLGERGTLRLDLKLAGQSAEDTAAPDYVVGERSTKEDWDHAYWKEQEELNQQWEEQQWREEMSAYWGEVWEVTGGADSGGIEVRKGWHVFSPRERQTLSHGALVKNLELDGQRLHYSKLTGDGPESGWVNTEFNNELLVIVTDKRPPMPRDADCQRPQTESGASAPRPPGAHGRGGLANKRAMRRRIERWQSHDPSCTLQLKPVGNPITLFTKPSCVIRFYQNSEQMSECPAAGSTQPQPFFAISITSQACSRGRAGHDWNVLRTRVVPLLSRLGWFLLRGTWGVLPRPLQGQSAHPEWLPDVPRPPLPAPWKQQGDEAFRRGDFWLAAAYYSNAVGELPANRDEEAAVLRSNRAACLAKVGHHDGALLEARRATELRPDWAKPWSRLGLAASALGDRCAEESEEYFGYHWEACEAHARSVELQPTAEAIAALCASAARVERRNAVAARDSKARGGAAITAGRLGEGVAEYTLGIARIPPEPEVPAGSELDEACLEDEHAQLRAALFSNRAAALLQLHGWRAAAEDARSALAAQADHVRARCHLGAALLGRGLHEEAYTEFARARQRAAHARQGALLEQARDATRPAVRQTEIEESEDEKLARTGQEACLTEILGGDSRRARARFETRFAIDVYRPQRSTKIFAVSDLHLDQGDNEEWAHLIDDVKFQDDVLIVAGNIASTVADVIKALTILKAKFRRVFYTVGNHELWIDSSELALYPDSISKLYAIFSACDELGVDVAPAPVSEDVFIIPLLSWYNAEFDAGDPFPDPKDTSDAAAKWPMDRHESLWRYMLKLNEAHFRLTYHGTVITFSHFLPGPWAFHDPPIAGLKKTVGCEDLDDQVRSLRSKLHVFGHTRHKYMEVHNGVQYVQNPLGFPAERRTSNEPLALVYDGCNACMREWSIDGTPPPGYVQKVQRVSIFQMPDLQEGSEEWEKMQAIVAKFNQLPGIYASFNRFGTSKHDQDALATESETWDMWDLYGGFTHGLFVIADGLKEFKGWLHSSLHKRDWARVAEPKIRMTVSVDSQLGMDLVPPKSQKDPLLVFGFMRLETSALGEESELWPYIWDCIEKFNEIPGIKASFMPAGFGGFAWPDWINEVWCPDKCYRTSYMLTVACNNLLCFKRWKYSDPCWSWINEVLPHCFINDEIQHFWLAPLPWDIAAKC